MRISLTSSVQDIPKIGPKTAQQLERLGVKTVKDALFLFPTRYEDFRTITPISHVRGGSSVCVRGKIQLINASRSPRKRMRYSECLLEDKSGSIKVIWFNQPYLAQGLARGDEIFVAGRVEVGKYGIQFVNPVYERASENPTHTARVVPVYPLTQALTQKTVRALIKAVLPLAPSLKETIPDKIRSAHGLLPLAAALQVIHFPVTISHAEQARETLGVRELVHLLLSLSKARNVRTSISAKATRVSSDWLEAQAASLPFALTKDQQNALDDIVADLRRTYPMYRLLNGDVGSGKTVLAHLAARTIMESHGQTAFLAPTDIVATQHFHSYKKLFPEESEGVALFTRTKRIVIVNGQEKTITKKDMLERLGTGMISYVIGTHTLIQRNVEFTELQLVIIDEQHRFGVAQRGELATRAYQGNHPHYLSLTATPIPRSLARLLYAGADVSLLGEKPGNRKPVKTIVLSGDKRNIAYEHITREVAAGSQAFVICPIIEESDTLGVKAATKTYEHLSHDIFPNLRVSLLHGKLTQKEKDQNMQLFVNSKTDILVATAVVEVGVDIPNATTMLIEAGERFGLAQLHQFRGRIGRNDKQATCFVIQTDESKGKLPRLEAFEKISDGFELAQTDLELRGPGTLFGTMQSGMTPLKIAHIENPKELKRAQAVVRDLLQLK